MAKNGVLFERDNFITQMVNRGGVASVDIAGGSPVVEGGVNATDKELYDLTAYATGGTKVAIAFNPSKKYNVIGGKKYPAQSLDDRDYVNIAGDVVDYFIPEVGIEFGVTADNITGTASKGKFLECANGSLKYVVADTQTASVPSFEVIDTETVEYLDGSLADNKVTVFLVKTRFNG